MNEEALRADIDRIKNQIKNTESPYRKRDMRLYLKILKRELKKVQKNENQGS